jgi:hypothetical protein
MWTAGAPAGDPRVVRSAVPQRRGPPSTRPTDGVSGATTPHPPLRNGSWRPSATASTMAPCRRQPRCTARRRPGRRSPREGLSGVRRPPRSGRRPTVPDGTRSHRSTHSTSRMSRYSPASRNSASDMPSKPISRSFQSSVRDTAPGCGGKTGQLPRFPGWYSASGRWTLLSRVTSGSHSTARRRLPAPSNHVPDRTGYRAPAVLFTYND